MEKQAVKPRNAILKFLPKAASAVYFHNPPFSPSRDKRLDIKTSNKLKAHAGRGFSGPLIIPDQARRKPKHGFETTQEDEEPTSPKVSCMGQIKHKKHQLKKMNRASNLPPRDLNHHHHQSKPSTSSAWSPREIKKHAFVFRRMFSSVKPGRSKSDGDYGDDHHHKRPSGLPDRAPSLSQTRRFASGRSHAFANFDWEASQQIAPLDHRYDQNYYSDEEIEGDSDELEAQDHARLHFSAPLSIGGGVPLQPRKEINLWKRRTMARPCPLQLKPVVR